MKKLLFVGSIVALAVTGLTHAASTDSQKQNERLAGDLLARLQKKVELSLSAAESKPLLPWNPERLTMQCLSDEMQYQDIQRQVLLPWQRGWKQKSAEALGKITTEDFAAQDLKATTTSKTSTFDGITVVSYGARQDLLARDQGLRHVAEFLGDFKDIGFAELVTEKFLSSPDSRSEHQKMKEATLWVRYDLRGSSSQSARLEHRGVLKAHVVLKDGQWKMSRLELVSGERLSTNVDFFENVTRSSKVAEIVPSYLRREAIRRGGYALAVSDFNRDGSPDLFVGTVAGSVLAKGDKNMRFTRVQQDELSRQTLVKSAAFADLTNSGNQDLVLVRFAPNEAQTAEDRSDIEIFRNTEGNFTKRDKVIKFNKETAYAMPLAIADFNNDGFLDLYVGFPGAKDFTTLSKAAQAKGLTTEGVFYNQGDGTYKDDPYKSFAKAHGNVDDLSKIFPHSALAVDYNQDGNMDLVVIDDRGNLSPIYVNKGKGDFEVASQNIGIGMMDYGMGVDVGDLNATGRLDFVMSAVNFNAARRVKESCALNWSVQDTVSAGVYGLRSFEAGSNGHFTETTAKAGLDWVGEGAGGVKLVDYNNDGLPDIYLTNGLWTGSEDDSSQDISSLFIAASSLGILEDNLQSPLKSDQFVFDRVIKNNDFKSLIFHSDSQSSVMNILSFFRGDVTGHHGKKAAPSLAGNQRNRLFHNNGDGTFTEVAYMMGVDSKADGYMPATFDMKRDGNLDLVLRNADPGYAKDQYPAVEIFRNNGAIKNKAIVLTLEGTASNRDAIGAIVEAKVGDKSMVRELLANAGTVQSEKLVHIGLGTHEKADLLKIRWPSGRVQVLQDVNAGYHHIVEPPVQISQAR